MDSSAEEEVNNQRIKVSKSKVSFFFLMTEQEEANHKRMLHLAPTVYLNFNGDRQKVGSL